MVAVNWLVKVYVGGVTSIPNIGLTNGVIEWQQSTGILTESFCDKISKSVDVTVSGNYEKYNSITLDIISSKLVEETLNNANNTLINKTIDVIAVSGAIERVEYRGVIRNITTIGNVDTLNVQHLANSYNVAMTPPISDKYATLIFGQNISGINVPMKSGSDSLDFIKSTSTGEDLYPAFKVSTGGNTEINIMIYSVYDSTIISEADINSYFQSGEDNLLKLRSQNTEMLGYFGGVTFTHTDGANDYNGILFLFHPANLKNIKSGTTPFRPVIDDGETVTIFRVEPDTGILPYGVDVDLDNLYFISDGVKTKFPFYVDYLKNKNSQLLYADVDGIGDVFAEPSIVKWQPLKEGVTIDPIIDGVWVWATDGLMLDPVASTTGAELIAHRKQVDTAKCLITGKIKKDVGATFSIWNTNVKFDYVIKSPKDFSELLATMRVVVNVTSSSSEHPIFAKLKIRVVTLRDIYNLHDHEGATSGGTVNLVDFLFPTESTYNTQNTKYRWDNDGENMLLYHYLDLLGFTNMEEWEKQNPITVRVELGVRQTIQNDDNVTFSVDYQEISFNAVGVKSAQTSQLQIESVSSTDSVEDVRAAYIATCKRQNYTTALKEPPIEGWGLIAPSYNLDDRINIVDITANAPQNELVYKTDSVTTNNVKYDLLRYGFGLGYIDTEGLENWSNVLDIYNGGGVPLSMYDFKENTKPTTHGIDTTKIFCNINIETTNGSVKVSNTEQATYNPEYVTGVDSAEDKLMLWTAGRLLYKQYGVKNEYPRKLVDANGVVDSVEHLKNIYRLQGVVFGEVIALREMYYLSGVISFLNVLTNNLQFGSKILLNYPYVSNSHTGVIIGYSNDIESGFVSLSALMLGGVMATSESSTIIESGDRADIIIESGTQPTTYIEVI